MGMTRYGIFIITSILLCTSVTFADYVTCESTGGYRHCSARNMRDAEVYIERQISKSSCTRGRSWGADERGVWVDDGCRATFEIARRGYDKYDSRDRYHSESIYRERRELEEERRELERERERLERERREAARAPVKETCPSGYVPGRCGDKQRKHGCKDFRMPGGLGCKSG